MAEVWKHYASKDDGRRLWVIITGDIHKTFLKSWGLLVVEIKTHIFGDCPKYSILPTPDGHSPNSARSICATTASCAVRGWLMPLSGIWKAGKRMSCRCCKVRWMMQCPMNPL
ncbi:hypothetical protein CDAR_597881 [Caerostris darwini]|uniref:Uncharacterized protein n=1 Tax=Caerostris darwini TaxID=1538125 RepID=A0AAV4QK01_9ARAC|nr:hypothetical protein CDAR_597881 [Caerostris darwini]